MLSERIEKIIEHIEKENGEPLSRLKVGVLSNSVLLELNKLDIVYLDGTADGDIIINEGVYKTKAGFYIYVKNNTHNLIVEGVILFEPSQLEEVKFTITRLKKIK